MRHPQPVCLPTAVCNWLEVELESLGIDSELYTRYIISLLESDGADEIIEDEQYNELNRSHSKKGSKIYLSGGCKPLRHLVEWWPRFSDASAERLKRSAVVKCLLSASISSSKSEIETLVDELCRKLKAVNNVPEPSSINKKTDCSIDEIDQRKVLSPHQQAKEYFTAFPALDPNSKPTFIYKNRRSPLWKCKPVDSLKKQHYKKSKTPRMSTIKKERNYFNKNDKKEHEIGKQPKIDDNFDELCMYDNVLEGIMELISDDDGFQNNNNNNKKSSCNPDQFLAHGTNITNSIWSQDIRLNDFDNFDVNKVWSLPTNCPKITPNSEQTASTSELLEWSLKALNHDQSTSPFNVVKVAESSFFHDNTEKKQEPGNLFNNVLLKLWLLPEHEEPAILDKIDNKKTRPVHVAKTNSEKEDLLTSPNTHFKPIEPEPNTTKKNAETIHYKDGHTFNINNQFNKFRYMKYDDLLVSLFDGFTYKVLEQPNENGFGIKFRINPNDAVCQMDENDIVSAISDEIIDTDDIANEMTWKNNDICARCFINDLAWHDGLNSNKNHVDVMSKNIWRDADVCKKCVGATTSSYVQQRLREDITQDGEELLSDLSLLQRDYMDEEVQNFCLNKDPIMSTRRLVMCPRQNWFDWHEYNFLNMPVELLLQGEKRLF